MLTDQCGNVNYHKTSLMSRFGASVWLGTYGLAMKVAVLAMSKRHRYGKDFKSFDHMITNFSLIQIC